MSDPAGLLTQSVVRKFNGKVRFVVENYGGSELAKRFGVTRYPAIFVEDVLVAKPKDFGFYGKGEGVGEGRYTPWKDVKSHERYRSDLKRMIELVLANKIEDLRKERTEGAEELAVDSLPAFQLTDLNGGAINSEKFAGKVVLVEFWATWCPPCRSTLAWLGGLQRKYADKLVVLAIAVESDEDDVKQVTESLNIPVTWAMGNADIAREFGDISAVPTLFLFDADGVTRSIFYGAPPELHDQAEKVLLSALSR